MITDPEIWKEELENLRKEHRMAGMSAALTDREKVLWAEGFGVTSVEKPRDLMSGKTLSRIASNTKFTVGLCVMKLVEEGVLSLDAPLSTYLPWFTLREREAAEKITLRKVLSHTAGLPVEYTPDGLMDEEKAEEVMRKELETLTLTADPDAGHYLYANQGFRLAGLCLTAVTGKKYSLLARELVLDPLGMKTSTFDLRVAATYPLSLPHGRNEAGDPEAEHMIHQNAARYAAGGLYSSAEEMCALARVKLNMGAPVLSQKTFDKMRLPHADMGPETGGQYCLALMKRPFGDRFLYGHTGSNPPYYSCIWTDPEAGYGVTFTTNTSGGSLFTNHLIPELFVRMLEEKK